MFVTCKIPLASGVGSTEINIRLFKNGVYRLALYLPTCVLLWTRSSFPTVGFAAKINCVLWLALQHKWGMVSNLEQFDRSKRRKWKKILRRRLVVLTKWQISIQTASARVRTLTDTVNTTWWTDSAKLSFANTNHQMFGVAKLDTYEEVSRDATPVWVDP